MNNKTKIVQQVLTKFQEYKGKASLYCFSMNSVVNIVGAVINAFRVRHSDKIFIVVNSYETRKKIINELNNLQIDTEYIKFLSADYVKLEYKYRYYTPFTIIVGVNENIELIKKLTNESKFTLCVLTKNIMNDTFINAVRDILPNIAIANFDNVLRTANIYSPVEEYRCGVDLSDNDREIYDKCNKYITDSITIFGDLDTIDKCRVGDIKNNISATEMINIVATRNGWNNYLDCSIDFMKKIDDLYNPTELEIRAKTFYNITRERQELVANNNAKFDIIKDICSKESNKNILIVSKSGEFAAKITKYLNDNANMPICGDYHDCIKPAIAIDDNNNVILIKSGDNKGKPKILQSQAQCTINERRFNDGVIKVLSIKNASNSKLQIACDVVIITSPLCDNIIGIKERFSRISFNTDITKVYKIYCNDTIENDKLLNEKKYPNVKIINENEDFIRYDENLGNIIL